MAETDRKRTRKGLRVAALQALYAAIGRRGLWGKAPCSGRVTERRARLSCVSHKHRLDDVFGVAREVPINYVVSDGVDGIFVSNLARNKHIVVFGSSKQGDQTDRKLKVVDRGFLIWLGHQDRGDLLTEAELPDPRDIQPTLTQ